MNRSGIQRQTLQIGKRHLSCAIACHASVDKGVQIESEPSHLLPCGTDRNLWERDNTMHLRDDLTKSSWEFGCELFDRMTVIWSLFDAGKSPEDMREELQNSANKPWAHYKKGTSLKSCKPYIHCADFSLLQESQRQANLRVLMLQADHLFSLRQASCILCRPHLHICLMTS